MIRPDKRLVSGKVEHHPIPEPSALHIGRIEVLPVTDGHQRHALLIRVAPGLLKGRLESPAAGEQRAGPLHFENHVLGDVLAEDDIGEADLVGQVALRPVEDAREQVFKDGLGNLLALPAMPEPVHSAGKELRLGEGDSLDAPGVACQRLHAVPLPHSLIAFYAPIGREASCGRGRRRRGGGGGAEVRAIPAASLPHIHA